MSDFLADPHFPGGGVISVEMRQHSGADIDAFTDIERQAVFAVKQINTGAFRHVFNQSRIYAARQRRSLEQICGGLADGCSTQFTAGNRQKLYQHFNIAHRPVAGGAFNTVPLDDGIQPMTVMLGIEPARELDRTERLLPQIDANAFELVLQKAMIETHVMRTEHRPFQIRHQLISHFPEQGRGCNHAVVNTSELLDER